MVNHVNFSNDENQQIAVLVALIHYLKSQHYQFTTVTPITHQLWLDRRPQPLARDLRDIFGWSLPFTDGLLDVALFEQLRAAGYVVKQQNAWQSTLRVSRLDDQLFIHSAFPTTQTDAVFFGPDTYRFATALQQHLQQVAQPILHAVEICSGAAPAAILIAKHAPTAKIYAIDINPQALLYSAANAVAAAATLQPVNNNLLAGIETLFDLIVANPPFMMDPAKRAYRDGGGLYGGELALRIVAESLPRLSVTGALLLYTGVCIVAGRDVFYEHIQQLLSGYSTLDWRYNEIDPDIFADELTQAGYEQVERIAAIVLHIQRR